MAAATDDTLARLTIDGRPSIPYVWHIADRCAFAEGASARKPAVEWHHTRPHGPNACSGEKPTVFIFFFARGKFSLSTGSRPRSWDDSGAWKGAKCPCRESEVARGLAMHFFHLPQRCLSCAGSSLPCYAAKTRQQSSLAAREGAEERGPCVYLRIRTYARSRVR